MNQTAINAQRLCEMMDERIRTLTPQERDRLMQQNLAQAKTSAERFHTLCVLMDFAIARHKAGREGDNG